MSESLSTSLDTQIKAIDDAEEVLWRLDAALADADFSQNDKLRTLVYYAWQEARDRIRSRPIPQTPLPSPTREELNKVWAGYVMLFTDGQTEIELEGTK